MKTMTAKSLVKRPKVTYNEAKYTLAEFYDLGIIFNEADILKRVMDENRAIEQNLCETYLSIEELADLEKDLLAKQNNDID